MASSVQVGIIGTGYAAQKRAEALQADPRSRLIVATGNTPEKLQDFCQRYQVQAVDSWSRLIDWAEIDLVFICTINQDCGAIAKAALLAGKDVVVEYPLALSAQAAAAAIQLAETHHKLLHVEHMEIIGGLHLAMKEYLPQIAPIYRAHYITINAQPQVKRSWKYHRGMFGFPLAAALSRVHRLTDLFGSVDYVTCRDRYWDVAGSDYFTACLCTAQLNFDNGITAEITYGKGDKFYRSQRTFEIYGEQGMMIFEGQTGKLISAQGEQSISVAPRRGLFAKDTTMVLDHLFNQAPLYINPAASLYALRVANAAEQAAQTRQLVYVD